VYVYVNAAAKYCEGKSLTDLIQLRPAEGSEIQSNVLILRLLLGLMLGLPAGDSESLHGSIIRRS